jgi:hypothetical protein
MTDEQATMEGRELADAALRHIRGLEALNAELLAALKEVQCWFVSQMDGPLRERVESVIAKAEERE